MAFTEHYALIPVDFLKNIPNVAIAQRAGDASRIAISGKSIRTIQKLLPHSIILQPKTTWNKELQTRQGVKNYAALE